MQNSLSKTGGLVKWESPFGAYKTTFKNHFYARKSAHVSVTLVKLFQEVAGWRPWAFERGIVGVYTTLQIIGPDGKKYLWLCLDVEHPQHHDNRVDNIRVAQSLFLALAEAGLNENLQIILTGRGFRFCWPYLVPPELTRALKEFGGAQYGIDTSTLKPSSFTRHFAYFGNRDKYRQHKNPYDGHTHLLNKPEHILGLDGRLYADIIAGGLAHDKAVEWLSKILPSKPLPAAWLEALQPYADELKLRNAIIKFPRLPAPGQTGGGNLKQALAECDRMGITYTADETSVGTIYRLSECPACHRKDANPYLTASGRLKHWTTRCDAGQRGDDDRPVGLHPSGWISNFVEAFGIPETELADSGVTLDEARHQIEQAARGAECLVIVATPGSGKTTSCLIGLSDHVKTQIILLAEPTNIKADEVYEEARRWLPGANIYRITGRTKDNCIRFQQTESIAKQGFSPGTLICPMCKKRLERRGETCPYFEQFKKTGPRLCITSHEQCKYLEAETLIIDEDGWQAFQKEESFLLGEFYSFIDRFQQFSPEPEKLRDIIERIHQAAADCLLSLQGAKSKKKRQYEPEISILFNKQPNALKASATIADHAKLTRADITELLRFTAFFDQMDEETPYQWQRRLYSGVWGDQQFYKRGTLNLKVLNWLKVLGGEMPGGCTIEIYRDDPDAFKFCRQWSYLPKIKGRYILLDGTGCKPDADKLFGRDFRLLDIKIPLKGCEFHHIRRACGKRKALFMDQQTLRKLLEEASALLRPADKKVLIATHMGLKGNFEKKVGEVARAVMPGRTVETIHFCGTRGLNLFKGFDACILFGTFTKNLLAAWKRAITLYSSEAEQARCIKAQSDAENLQTVHRVRPVNGGKNIIVISRSWIPGLPAPQVYNQRRGAGAVPEIEQGYHRLRMFYESFGFVSKGIGWFLGVGCKKDADSLDSFNRSFQAVMEQELTPSNFGILPNIIYLLHRIPKKTGVNKLVLGSPTYWNNYVKRLKLDFPGGGDFEASQGLTSKKPGKGVGTVAAAQLFYEGLGFGDNFQPDLWHQITPGRIPETSIFSKSKTGPERRLSHEPTKNQHPEMASLPEKHTDGLFNHSVKSNINGHPRPDCSSKKRITMGRTPQQVISGSGGRKIEVETGTGI